VKSVLDGTFTPAHPSKKVLTAEEKIQRKKAEQIAEVQREKLALFNYSQQQAAYRKAQEQAGKTTKTKTRSVFPLHGLFKTIRA